jgi:hypothetical protein
MSPISLGSKISRAMLNTGFQAGPYLAYSSILKMEATCFSETSVGFQRTARRYISEDKVLYF